MLWLALTACRLVQYLGAMALLGAPLLLLRGRWDALPLGARLSRRLLTPAAAAVFLGAAVAVPVQTAVMAGSWAAVVDPSSLATVIATTQLGWGLAARIVLGAACLILLAAMRTQRPFWRTVATAGAVITASFAWTGHAASGEGSQGLVQLAADVFHLWAAGVWIGALAGLGWLLAAARSSPDFNPALHRALAGFSGVGSLAVAVLVATGLVNSWFLVGLSKLADLPFDRYGQVLLAKLAAFAVMLALAWSNRFRLTPQLGQALEAGAAPEAALAALRRSVRVETALAALVLALVAVLGALEPPSGG